jgi:CxC2 like cysteine cluster associated with KDZ transposases
MNSYRQTQKDYIEQYVDRMDDLLEAMLTREAMPEGPGTCRHCDKCVLAVWRCRDCVLGTPMCRACMRHSHRENPFHLIEQWNGAYFRRAELWEVGTYLFVRHHTGEVVCETLRVWCNLLEMGEERKDREEQEVLNRYQSAPVPVPAPDPEQYFDDSDIDINTGQPSGEEDNIDEDDVDDGENPDDDKLDGNPYLASASAGAGAGAGASSATFGTYVRVIHSNGIHHIAMVSCQCHGQEFLPLDLLASQLLPASFKRIKTLFTAQVLDMYRLCNLELKASAYQFYQLLRRLTRPMAPDEVINLYREFRRMSRLWRWMKKLKWAGYAGSSKTVQAVKPGELATYCPACPQPGINIPNNWKDDPTRYDK